jgi:hypothetical protein
MNANLSGLIPGAGRLVEFQTMAAKTLLQDKPGVWANGFRKSKN